MNPSERKAHRLLQVEALLLAHPEGFTQADIARKLGVNRSTINRYAADLPKHIYIDDLDGNKWKVDRSAYLVNVRLNLHEALAVHLAARLLATRMDRQNPHAAAALRKLGVALETLAPQISQHLLQSADVMDDIAQRHDPRYLQVLETLTIAWAERRKVQVWHRLERTGKVHDYIFSPYFIEPYAVGQTTHVIGRREPPGELRTFKIERIERIESLRDPYTIPDDFDPRALLADAWGIWYTEKEPQEIVLRFHRRVAHRVRESRWHQSQEVSEQADGSLVWRAQVAHPQEMVPWIRGWGADCEVIAPQALRNHIRAEVIRQSRLYEIEAQASHSPLARLLSCWGKTDKTDWAYHPALFHMLDVGHVAQALLSQSASQRWRRVLAKALGRDAETVANWVPWFVALHDIGKISVPFQAQNEAQRQRLQEEGLTFGRWHPQRRVHHTHVGQVFLKKEFPALHNFELPHFLQRAWIEMIGGHHGRFTDARTYREASKTLRTLGEPPVWPQLRAQASRILQSFLLPQTPQAWPKPLNVSAAIMALTGFTILCDWLGSDSRHFPLSPHTDIFTYVGESKTRAEAAVGNTGFFQATQSDAPATFTALFPDRTPARPLQQAIDEIPQALLQQPCLAIIEAPTGEGKTEAALALARRLAMASGSDELYCALPTTATSNQMFVRLQEHLQQRLALATQVRLVHGQAFLVEDDLLLEPLTNGPDTDPHASLEWFSPKKKALLAPFGVGTVDQAELAALNVRHNALRLIGLAGKVVILDEVHAYDTYMSTIIEQMLRWLSALGSSVILLSATLPRARRAALAAAYGATIDDEMQAYPSLWVGSTAGTHHATPPAHQPDRRLKLGTIHMPHEDVSVKAQWLRQTVKDEGCACWITNTVDRAQKLFAAVTEREPELDCLLLHARFPLEERQALEQQVVDKYGPDGQRPLRGVVIGTQVLEQSLDLDFDVMVSDLAPIDLLLQRAGRLHRHQRPRPNAHRTPHFWIHCELAEDGRLEMGKDKFYTEYILRRTWQTLKGREEITLPQAYRPLVEAVYAEEAPPEDSPLAAAWEALQTQQSRARQEAQLRLLPEPEADRPFCAHNRPEFEEDENSTAWMVAQTRLGPETVTVVPLEKEGGWARLVPLGERVELGVQLPRATELRLLRRSLRLSQWTAVQALKEVTDPLFAESSLLKNVVPLWLVENRTTLTAGGRSITLTLDEKLGLLIEVQEPARS